MLQKLILLIITAIFLTGCGASAPKTEASMDMFVSDDAAMDMGFDAGGAPMEDPQQVLLRGRGKHNRCGQTLR